MLRPPLAGRLGALLAFTLAASTWSSGALAQLSPRYDHSAIYDSARHRVLVYGGTDGAGSFYDDVWQLSLAGTPTWTPLATTGGPAARFAHSAIYDPVRNRMVVFGGLSLDGGVHSLDEVWSLSLVDSSWSLLQPQGTGPSARSSCTAIYDPACDRMLVYGGRDLLGNSFTDVWSLWLSPTLRWERLQLDPSSPIPAGRHHHTAIYDPVRQRMIVFAGFAVGNDVWALGLGGDCMGVTPPSWTQIAPQGLLQPPALSGHSAIYDPVADQMLVFGGNDGNQPRNETWFLPLNGEPKWSVLAATGDAPNVRAGQTSTYDPDRHQMIVFGGFPDNDEPTWALGPDRRWSPWRPKLEVSRPILDLPPMTAGDAAFVTFNVANHGMQPLDVTGVRLPQANGAPVPGMHLSPLPAAALQWNAAHAETLFLTASVPDTVNDSLVFISNDPLTPRNEVPVLFRVLPLQFATRILGAVPVRLGTSFDVVVTPEPGVHFERGTLFYRVLGDTRVDSLALTPLSTDFIATVPGSAVTEHEVEYWVRVENGAVQTTHAPSVVSVESPASVVAVHPRPTSGVDFITDRQIPVDVFLPAGAVFVSGAVYFRRGGETAWRSEALTNTAIPGAVIPDSVVGPRGVEYRIEAQTMTSTLRFPAADDAFESIRIKVLNLVEPAEHPAERYRLLSVPLDFAGNFSGSLDDLLIDQLDAYDPVKWRAFLYDPDLPDPVELSADRDRFRPVPGLAFWLVSRGAHRVDTQPAVGLSTPTDSSFAIELKRGWNLIGNPFDFPVAWDDVQLDAAVKDSLFELDPAPGPKNGYRWRGSSVMMPFDGYFVWADQATTIRVPPRAAVPVASPVTARAENPGGWRMELVASTTNAVDAVNELGFDAAASNGWDRLDSRKPPTPPGPWVRLATTHTDWAEHSGEYRRDLRAPGSEGETWEMELRSGSPGERVTLSFPGVPSVPPGFELWLVDREQGTATEVGAGAALSILSYGAARPYRLAVLAGTREYVERESRRDLTTPARLTLDPNAPNPFSEATRIRFGLSRRERVSLEVFDIQGHRVATLLDHALLPPGYHAMIWDGTSNGHRAPSGVYLLRLAGEETLMSRRVILAR